MRRPFFLPIILCCLLGACPRHEPAASSVCTGGPAACTSASRFGPVSLRTNPHPAPVMTPFSVELAVSSRLDSVTVNFNGRDMDMGPNTVRLTRAPDGPWRGTATLPICLTGPMTWQATVVLTQSGQTETLRFEFDTAAR